MATEKKITSRIQQKHDVAANWAKATNFIPKKGEIIIYDAEYNASGEETQAVRFKIGDGSKTVNNLPFAAIDYKSIKSINTNNTAAQEPKTDESIAGSGTINLHKIAKTGNYNDLLDKLTAGSNITINENNVISAKDTTYTFTANNPTLAWNTTSKIGTIGGVEFNVTMPANPNTHHTNYLQIKGNNTEAVKFTQNADKTLNFKPGANVSISATSGEITISSTDTNTATAADNILDGSNSGTEITYKPYTSQQSKLSFDTSTTNPTRTDRLNLNGHLHATKLYSGGKEVLTSHQDISGKLDKTTYEWNKEFRAGSNGAISLGRYNIYDTQLTFDISSTTSISMNGKLVIATQNGKICQAKVFGDATGTLVSKIVIYQSSIVNNRSWIEIFCNFDDWSKNKVHIYGVALESATVTNQMSSVTFTNGVPSPITSGDSKWSGTIDNDLSKKQDKLTAGSNITISGNTISAKDTTYTFTANNPTLAWNTTSKIGTIGGVEFNVTMPANPNTHHTNYLQIKGNNTEAVKFTQNADKTLNFKPGANVSISATSGEITISSTNTNTATAADDILDGSNSGTQIKYAPYTSQQSKLSFDSSNTDPTGTDRLNLNGYLYATKLYSGGKEVLTSHQPIPTVNNGTLTIQKNGTKVQTFTANQSTNVTANITVPTKVSQLTNDSGYTTNKGTVTSVAIKMNGSEKGKVTSSGTIDLGTVLTAMPQLKWVTPTSVSEIQSAILWKVTNEKSADGAGGLEIAIGSGQIGNGSGYHKSNSIYQYGLCNVTIQDSQTIVELIPYARNQANQTYRTNIVLSDWKILKLG